MPLNINRECLCGDEHSGSIAVGFCTGSDEPCDGDCPYWIGDLPFWKQFIYKPQPQPDCEQYSLRTVCNYCKGVKYD
jgi:hypothetical protein